MRVNVDDVAFMDRRFKLLGGRLGVTWYEALGRCLPVWALAYQRRSAVLPADDIDALAERPGFASAMISAELAAPEGDGLYLCGVTDRIDFLLLQDAKRERAREAKLAAAGVSRPPGRSRGKHAMPWDGPGGDSPGTVPGEVPGDGPYSPDHPPDLDLALPPGEPSRAILPSTEQAPAPPEPPPPPILPGSIARAEAKRRLIGDAWQLAGDAFRELGREGIEPTAPDAWSGMPAAGSEGMKRLIAIVDRLLVGDEPDVDRARAVIANRIDVAKTEGRAKSPPTRRWLTPMAIWSPIAFEHAATISPEQVRAGPRGSAERAPSNEPPRRPIKSLNRP